MSDADPLLRLPAFWAPTLMGQPETGMSYQVVTLRLNDGRILDRVVVSNGMIDLSTCEAFAASPFSVKEIIAIEVTHVDSGPPTFRRLG
jgi:hypothetical protein